MYYSVVLDDDVVAHICQVFEIKGIDIVILVHQVLVLGSIFLKTIYLYPSVLLAIMFDHTLLLLSAQVVHDIRCSVGVHLLQDTALVRAVY